MSLVRFETRGPVALVTLDRPPVNALSAGLSADLEVAFARCEDPQIRAVVVTGMPHFAAGADIKGFQAAYDSGEKEGIARRWVDAIWILERLAKPTIAAIHGFALGGGLELALGTDFRYLAHDAQVGQPEIKLGLIPGAGGTQRLTRVVGFQRAKDIVFSGRFVAAEEALAIGLADKVFDSDDLLDAAMADAETYAQGPTVALGAAKKSINDGWGKPMTEAMEIEAAAFDACFWTEDAKEGVAAFVEKRAAGFNGR